MPTGAETVFRGQEGTGAAGVFGAPQNPLIPFFERVRQNDAVNALKEKRRLTALTKREKEIKEHLAKGTNPAGSLFKTTILKRLQENRNAFRQALSNNPNLSVSDIKDATQEDRDALNLAATKSQEIEAIGTQLQEDFDTLPNFNGELANKVMIGKFLKADTPEKILALDSEELVAMIDDPTFFDEKDFFKNAAEEAKFQLDSTQQNLRDDNGSFRFVEKIEDKILFVGRDANGNVIPKVTDETAEFYLKSNKKFEERMQFLVLGGDKELLETMKNSTDPTFNRKVLDLTIKGLEEQNKDESKYSKSNFGKTFRDTDSTTKIAENKFSGTEILTSETGFKKDLVNIGDDNIAGGTSPSVNKPGMAKGIVLKDSSGKLDEKVVNVFGFGPSKETGETVIRASDATGGGFSEFPFTESNLAAITNAQTNQKNKNGFIDVVDRFNAARGSNTFLDRDSLDAVVNEIKVEADKILLGKSGSLNQEFAKNIKDILDKGGIEVESVKASSRVLKPNEVIIKISGDSKRFALGTKKGIEDLGQFLLSNGRSRFTTDINPNTDTQFTQSTQEILNKHGLGGITQ